MDLKTRLIIPSAKMHSIDVRPIEDALSASVVVANCTTCCYATWSDDGTQLACQMANNITPPLWAVAIGCKNYDYLPF